METGEPSQHSLVDTGKPRKTCVEVAGRRAFRILTSSHGSSIVHPIPLALHGTCCPGSRSELFVHTTRSVVGSVVQLHLGVTWLQGHTGLQAGKGPSDPVERGLVEPKDGLNMNKNPHPPPRIEPLPRSYRPELPCLL